MTVNDSPVRPVSVSRRSTWLRRTGIVVLLAGLAGAGTIYWVGSRSPAVSDDLSMVGYHRAERRQMGQLYGKMGTVIEDWSEDLKDPGTRAILVGGFAAAIGMRGKSGKLRLQVVLSARRA